MITIFLSAYAGIATIAGRRILQDDPLRKGDKICEILAPRVFHAVRQDDYAFRRQRLNRTFIMSHKHYRAAEASQRAEYLFPARRIKVVGRLIKQQDVRARYNKKSEGQPRLFSAGKHAGRFFHIIT